MKLEPKYTQDGSVTLLNIAVSATYHSRFGALQESRHIYIQAGLHYARQQFGNSLNVFEMGFGTGLNAWLSLEETINADLSIHYTGIEKYPVPQDLYSALNYARSDAEQERLTALLQAPWEQRVALGTHFSLLKQQGDIRDAILPTPLHLVYYDAFDPTASPESWQPEIFERLFAAMLPGAALVTFCARGYIKRLLKDKGFLVQALPGPPGKREITRAAKL